jgi:hypothetical protein
MVFRFQRHVWTDERLMRRRGARALSGLGTRDLTLRALRTLGAALGMPPQRLLREVARTYDVVLRRRGRRHHRQHGHRAWRDREPF